MLRSLMFKIVWHNPSTCGVSVFPFVQMHAESTIRTTKERRRLPPELDWPPTPWSSQVPRALSHTTSTRKLSLTLTLWQTWQWRRITSDGELKQTYTYLTTEHGCKLLGDTLEELLDGGGVADEGRGHLQAAGWNVADGCLDVVGDPLHKVAAVLVLHVQHLLVYLMVLDSRSLGKGLQETQQVYAKIMLNSRRFGKTKKKERKKLTLSTSWDKFKVVLLLLLILKACANMQLVFIQKQCPKQ